MTLDEFKTTLVLLGFTHIRLSPYMTKASHDSVYKSSKSGLVVQIVRKDPYLVRAYYYPTSTKLFTDDNFDDSLKHVVGHLELNNE